MLANTLSILKDKLKQLYSNLTATPCLLCGAVSHQFCLCTKCINDLPMLDSACPRCAVPTDNNRLCGKCMKQPPTQNTSISLFIYKHPVNVLIADFKYHDKLFLTQFFANYMAQKLKNNNCRLPDLLIPVPLHPKRLRGRGYNQSLELAKTLSKSLSVPVCYDVLSRTKNTLPQASLPIKARHQNVRRVFKISRHNLPPHVALIDDVLTTGHTANEAASVLRKAGVSNIEVWTIARTIS